MTEATIHVSVDDRGIASLVLARGDKHNAISAAMIEALTAASQRLGDDPDVRAVILSAQGKSFCAGGDLGWMRTQFASDRAGRLAEARRLALMFKALNEMPKPLIARVQGNAFGGGVGLVSVCDMAIAATTARFGLTEVRLGLIPATISPFVVARIGEGRARQLFMSGQVIDAGQALAAGMITRIVPVEELDAAVESEVGHFLSAAPGAVARAKALARSLGAPITDAVIDDVVAQLADCWEDAEAKEGISAFFEHRDPRWL